MDSAGDTSVVTQSLQRNYASKLNQVVPSLGKKKYSKGFKPSDCFFLGVAMKSYIIQIRIYKLVKLLVDLQILKGFHSWLRVTCREARCGTTGHGVSQIGSVARLF